MDLTDKKKARNQNNGTHWVGNEATNSLKQLDDELIVYMVYLVKMILSKDK